MARSRNIKASFFQNEQLGDLQPLERLFFIGLWTVADYKGCLEFRPKRLKIQILPYDDCSIEGIGINLEKSGLIASYSVLEKRYIKILNFIKHQNPHKNERDAGSDVPDINQGDRVAGNVAEQPLDNKGLAINPDKIGCSTDTIRCTRADSLILNPDSLILNPDSLILNPETKILNPETKESPIGSVNNQPTQLPTIRKPEKPQIDKASQYEMFSQFYSAYPKKTGRADAEKSWSKIDPNLYQKIIDDTKHRSLNHQPWLGDKQFINAPSVWLNGQRWDDEVIYPTASKSQNKATARVDDLKNAMLTFVAKNESGQDQNLLENSTSISQEPAKFFRGAEINTEASH